MLPVQQVNAPANPQGMITPNTGNTSSNYQELNNQFGGMSMNPSEQQQENPGLPKQRVFTPTSTQTLYSGQPVQFVVYPHLSGAMVRTPVSSPGQVNPAFVYPTPHSYSQPGYGPQVYNQVYPQQHFNQGFPLREQTLLPQGNGSHTPPQSGSSGFVQHVQAVPASRPQMPTPVLNPSILHTQVMNPYRIQGPQVVHVPGGQQLFAYTPVTYATGQNRASLQQPARYKTFAEKGSSKSNDIYVPETSNLRRPSPSDSPRSNTTSSNQNRRSSGGSGKGHGKTDAQRYVDVNNVLKSEPLDLPMRLSR